MFREYSQKYPDLAERLHHMQRRELPDGWDKVSRPCPADAKGIATRESSGTVLNVLAQNAPWLIVSADLGYLQQDRAEISGAGDFQPGSYAGPLHFGVREHVMGASVNGLVVSGIRAFRGDLLQEVQRLHEGVRLSALMEIPSIFILTHGFLYRRGRRRANASTD